MRMKNGGQRTSGEGGRGRGDEKEACDCEGDMQAAGLTVKRKMEGGVGLCDAVQA